MFQVTVMHEFAAAHAIEIRGVREPIHGHNWRVHVTVSGPVLDSDGLLVDFHDLEQRVERLVRPFHNRSLNDVPPFDETNPTAEHVAKHLAESLLPQMPPTVDRLSASVTEAPGCIALCEVSRTVRRYSE